MNRCQNCGSTEVVTPIGDQSVQWPRLLDGHWCSAWIRNERSHKEEYDLVWRDDDEVSMGATVRKLNSGNWAVIVDGEVAGKYTSAKEVNFYPTPAVAMDEAEKLLQKLWPYCTCDHLAAGATFLESKQGEGVTNPAVICMTCNHPFRFPDFPTIEGEHAEIVVMDDV